MRPMSDERAIENAIVSTQMEGFEVTESDRKLLMKIIKKEITLDEALKKINSRYMNCLWHSKWNCIRISVINP